MKKLIFLLAIVMMGCATQKRCFIKFPPEVKTDTIIEEVITYRDTTIEVFLPGDTIYTEAALVSSGQEDGSVLIPDPFYSDTVRAFGTYSEASAWVESRKIALELIEHDTTIKVKLDSVIKIKDHFEHLYTVEVHKEPPVIKVPWYYRWSLPVALVLILMIVLIFVLKR